MIKMIYSIINYIGYIYINQLNDVAKLQTWGLFRC